MDEALILILIIGGAALIAIPFFSFFILSEVKKVRKEMVKIELSINQMKTSLTHQTLKIEMMNKHLGIIGSNVAPHRYKKRPLGRR